MEIYIFQNLKKNSAYEVANIIKVIDIILNMQNMYDLDTYNSKSLWFFKTYILTYFLLLLIIVYNKI